MVSRALFTLIVLFQLALSLHRKEDTRFAILQVCWEDGMDPGCPDDVPEYSRRPRTTQLHQYTSFVFCSVAFGRNFGP